MALTIGKTILILVAVINLVLVSVFTMLGKTRLVVAFPVLQAFIVASAVFVN